MKSLKKLQKKKKCVIKYLKLSRKLEMILFPNNDASYIAPPFLVDSSFCIKWRPTTKSLTKRNVSHHDFISCISININFFCYILIKSRWENASKTLVLYLSLWDFQTLWGTQTWKQNISLLVITGVHSPIIFLQFFIFFSLSYHLLHLLYYINFLFHIFFLPNCVMSVGICLYLYY